MKKGFGTLLQVQFDITKDWGMPRIEGASTHEATTIMSEDVTLWKLIKAQVEALMGKLLVGKVIDDNFISMHREKVLFQSAEVNLGKHATEIRRKELLDTVDKHHTFLKEKGKLSGSMILLLKSLFRFEEWNLKDSRLTDDSECSNFQPHNDFGKFENTDE